MSAHRNLKLFLPYQIASLEGLSQGLYLVWLLHAKHLRPEVAALVLSAGSVALTLLEVPTGMLADRFGHRGSLIAGSLAQIAGIALFWQCDSLAGLTAGSLAVALGDALRSGADAAILYESCVLLGRPGDFGPIYARSSAGATIALAGLTLAGGSLAELAGFDVAWAAELALCAAGLVIALSMVAVPVAENPDEDNPGRSFGLPSRESLATLILPTTLGSVLFAVFELLVQARWPAGQSLILLTAVVAGAALTESLGALVAARRGRDTSLLALGMAAAATALAGSAALTPAFWALGFLLGWARPLCAERIQRLAKPGERASAASWAGVIDMAASAILLPLAAAAFAQGSR